MKFRPKVGERFGRYTLSAPSTTRKHYWICKCDCGSEREVYLYSLLKGATQSCGCQNLNNLSARGFDLTGKRFGRLVVIGAANEGHTRTKYWRCACDCGNIKNVKHAYLLKGSTTSCDCRWQEIKDNVKNVATVTHGCESDPLYPTWRNMMNRCYDPKDPRYHTYGARGITVCERWHDVRNFIADMGARPPGLTLERKNNDAEYSPENCCWATRTAQIRNRTIVRMVEFQGEIKPLAVWCEEFNLPYKVVHARLNRYHWTIERALTTPLMINQFAYK